MKRFLAALAVFAVALSARGQEFDFRTTGPRTMQTIYLRCSTIVPSLSPSNWAALWVPCTGPLQPPTPAYNAGNVYISQNTGAWTLLSSFVGSGVVNSIFGRTGTVVAVSGDYTGTLVTNTPAGGVAATTVQAAINELDTEKAPLASPSFAGVPAVPTAAPGTNTTQAASTAFTTAAVAAAASAVTSVFTRTGAVTAQQADYDSFFTTTAEASAAAPVQSVFGRTGAVTGLAADYDAFFLTPAEGNAAYFLNSGGAIVGTAFGLTGSGVQVGIDVSNASTADPSIASMDISTARDTSPTVYMQVASPSQGWQWGLLGNAAHNFVVKNTTSGLSALTITASDSKVTTNLSATSTGVTAAAADSDTSLATTAFVQQEAPVKSVAGMTGNVTIASTDLTDSVNSFKGGTGIDSSASTGVPRLLSGVWTIDAGISHLASSTSAQLDTVLSDDTGSGVAVFNDTPTILTPTIASFVNATHTHVSAATGGALDAGAIGSGTLPLARGGTNAVDAAGARTSLGLAIGSDVQAFDADLDALASSSSTGTGAFVRAGSPTFTGAPVLAAATATTFQTTGNVGIGQAPSGVTGEALVIGASSNIALKNATINTGNGTLAYAANYASSNSATVQMIAFSTLYSGTILGVAAGGWASFNNGGVGNGVSVGTINAAPLVLATSNAERMRIDSAGVITSTRLAPAAGTMTGTTEAVLGDSTTCRAWDNTMVAALAGTAGDIAWGTIAADVKVIDATIKITGAAVGPATVTVALGRVSAGYIDYIPASDAKGVANTVYGDASGERGTNLTGYDYPSPTGTTVINAHFISTGANLSTVTGSTGKVCVTTRKLP